MIIDPDIGNILEHIRTNSSARSRLFVLLSIGFTCEVFNTQLGGAPRPLPNPPRKVGANSPGAPPSLAAASPMSRLR